MKTPILIISSLVLGFAFGVTQPKTNINYRDAVKVAYQMGSEERIYENDDIGVVRLSLNDIEDLIGAE